MSVLPVDLLGREVDLLPPLLLGAPVLAKQVVERLLARGAARGRRSGRFGTVCLFIAYVTSLALALWCPGAGLSHVAAIAAGGALWCLAAALRIWSMAHLREHFSYFVEIREEHRLVETGPYAIVRHPLHLGFALEVTAFGIVSGSPAALAPVALVWLTVFLRNPFEEAALRDHFGPAWDAYSARVPSMNPLRALARLAKRSRPF